MDARMNGPQKGALEWMKRLLAVADVQLQGERPWDLRFQRMWRCYLLSCAGAFRARDIQLWQWVLSKGGVPGGYTRVS